MPSFNNREGIPQFPFQGYQVRLASGTSIFNGETQPITEKPSENNVWTELERENYQLIENTLFTINTVEKMPGTLSGISPKLHIELTFLEQTSSWFDKTHVVLILDNDQTSLVDWSVANPTLDLNFLFEQNQNNTAIYFDIPLVPVSKSKQEYVLTEERANFLDQISQWENGQQLTFGIFSIEDKDIHNYPFYIWPPWFYPPFCKEISQFADLIALKIDRILKQGTDGDEQLLILDNGKLREIISEDLVAMKNRALLLCHGILSSTQSAFSGILEDPEFMAHLHQRYNKSILAWDHYTLSKTTSDNASDLLMKLKDLNNIELDIICHSRGAGVIRNFVENPKNIAQLNKQGVTVKKIVYVAGACLGSQLADTQNTNRLFRRLNMLFWFFGGAPIGFTHAILVALKLFTIFAQRMPGVESMNPTGSEIAKLNTYGKTMAQEYYYICANYDVRLSLLPIKLAEELLLDSGIFEGAANDLIVPYEGASVNNKYLPSFTGKKDALNYGTLIQGQSDVWHINFFSQNTTKNELTILLPVI